MKKIIFCGILLICIGNVFMKNGLYTIYMCAYALIPISSLLFLNYKDICCSKKKEIFDNNFKFLLECTVNIFIIIYALFNFICIINNITNDAGLMSIYYNSLYYIFVIGVFIFINYYSTRSFELRKKIRYFLKIIINFFTKNFILNLFAIIISFIFRRNENLLFGILGSYAFLFLTEVNNEYKKMESTKKYDRIYIFLQVFMNFVLMYYMSDFEKIFFYITNGTALAIDYWWSIRVGILILAIIINYNGKKVAKILHSDKIKKIKELINQ